MPNKTKIQWTNFTSNPLVPVEGGWGCTKVSAGCDHCYSETLNKRLGNGREFKGRWQFTLKETELVALARLPGSHHIFICDMTDLFHSDVPWDFTQKAITDSTCGRSDSESSARGEVKERTVLACPVARGMEVIRLTKSS